MAAEPGVGTVHEWEMPVYNLDAFKAKVAQANGKLVRAGLDARFEITYTPFERARTVSDAPENQLLGPTPHVVEPWVRATLAGPLTLRHGHYTFAASLVAEEAGVTVHCAPGQELGGYTPKGTTECDHCGVDRNRARLYLVRDERDGSIIQLGHSCIELYTGIAPKGLWALTFDAELDAYTEPSEGGFGRRDLGAAVNSVLAYAYAHTNQGRNYVPAGADGESTGDRVRMSLFGDTHRLREAERQYYRDKAAEAATFLDDAELLAAIKDAVSETGEDTDYGRNLRVILAGESVSGRNVGILASLVKVYARRMQIEAERKANPPAKGFIGQIKERIRNITLALTAVREIDGRYGTTTLFIGRTGDGHVIKWFASGTFKYEIGDTLKVEAATVKDHENYQGQDQTVITRAKIDTFAERAEKYQAFLDAHDGKDEGFVAHRWDYAASVSRTYTVFEIDRWFDSKAEKKRFTQWQAELVTQ
ncbi:MAG: hypothetical protein WCE30_10165 [Mycobacterium sp.]